MNGRFASYEQEFVNTLRGLPGEGYRLAVFGDIDLSHIAIGRNASAVTLGFVRCCRGEPLRVDAAYRSST